ncbi:hypothetical protein RHMOL_Rhmol03G0168500 [Rhododendron molle]|uniref:Uncharacterized protein n=1 Tax=Rhododendron molle TaxID=49168 RepID=A0ACC0PGK2_RHOML|nr:hypothetical protein RHMOL_Rhmol03G0168500 [Rhododendron molle]
MSNSATSLHNDLFSSLISDIKTYTGKDPLLPWLRGVRRMRESLPPHLLREKLPRFLQKCAQTFETDRRYTNDLRYLRIWLQLMDFVGDPRAVLRTMETNRIGMKKALFYQAYALYYEKVKKFEDADKIYHLGVQNLAEPIDELQKSYEQFLHRMERHKKKKIQRQERATKGILRIGSIPPTCNDSKQTNENICGDIGAKSDVPKKFSSEDTVVVRRFVDTAIVGKSEAEDACHHGLVEPTINTKEALNTINNMFREPIEQEFVNRKSHGSRPNAGQRLDKGFEVFVDENLTEAGSTNQNGDNGFVQEPFQIYIDDDEEGNEVEDRMTVKDHSEKNSPEVNAFVFPRPKEIPSECSIGLDSERAPHTRFREDTVVRKFVGATISDEPQVENVCHHGLVEPTVNLKEAMDDINGMFGKPIDFVRTNRRKKDKAPSSKNNCGGFVILPDDDLEYQHGHSWPSSTAKNESDLFEPTVCTKEAMDDINKMFGMPLDF